MKVVAFNASARKDGNTAVLLNTVLDDGLVPLFYHSDLETAKKVAGACLNRSVSAVLRQRGAYALAAGWRA